MLFQMRYNVLFRQFRLLTAQAGSVPAAIRLIFEKCYRNHDIITIDYYMDEYAYVNKLRQFIMTQLESKQESIVSEQ